jgi:predicted DNA-binding transcriptional regulator YafY
MAAGSSAVRRADRLFQIIQILRGARQPLTAERIGAELEVSKRTVYRDIADLIGQRVPIRGEAGLGYMIDADFDMPPLMLTRDEIEAAVLGAQWVMARGDPVLAKAARDLVAKIATAVPDHLRPYVMEPASGTPPGSKVPPDGLDIARTREWIHSGRKIRVDYLDGDGAATTRRLIWPIRVGYLDTVRLLIAWCELRDDFRTFRTDRISAAEFLDERHGQRVATLWSRWLSERKASRLPSS